MTLRSAPPTYMIFCNQPQATKNTSNILPAGATPKPNASASQTPPVNRSGVIPAAHHERQQQNRTHPSHVRDTHRPGSTAQHDAPAGLRTRPCYHCCTTHKHPFRASGCTKHNVSASTKPIDAILHGRLHPAPQSHRINNPAVYHTSTILSNLPPYQCHLME